MSANRGGQTELRRLRAQLDELIACAYCFNDKPHLLFSHIRRLANEAGNAEAARLMDSMYWRIHELLDAEPKP